MFQLYDMKFPHTALNFILGQSSDIPSHFLLVKNLKLVEFKDSIPKSNSNLISTPKFLM